MFLGKIFLTAVGLMYVALALWCTVSAARTAQSIGLEFASGSGKSEYITVYGGLQLGLGVVFLSAAWYTGNVGEGLLVSAILHGCITLLRTGTLLLVDGVVSPTYYLAALEVALFLASLALWWTLPVTPAPSAGSGP